MSSDRARYLDFVRRLALLTPVVVGCAAPSTSAPLASPPAPAAAPTSTSSAIAKDDPTTACRCAWDSNATSAPRVCADGEINHAGEACVRGADHAPMGGPKHPFPAGGPLAPPDLPLA